MQKENEDTKKERTVEGNEMENGTKTKKKNGKEKEAEM